MADLIGAARRKAGTLSQIGIRIGIRKTRSFYEGIRPNIGVTESIRLTGAELNSHGEEQDHSLPWRPPRHSLNS